MPRNYQYLQELYQQQKAMDKNGSVQRDIKDFESYYQQIQKNASAKGWYRSGVHSNFETFQNLLLQEYEEMKQGKVDAEKAKDLNDFLDIIKNDKDCYVKKLMRTVILDIYDTLAGDLDNPDTKYVENLKKAVALSDLYDRILNDDEKQDIRNTFSNGKAQRFLSNDADMNGNFSKTLKALYRKYQKAETEEKKAEWKKVCNSYTIRPYMQVIEKKVKQEDFEALPEDRKKEILNQEAKRKEKEKQLKALKDEAKTLGQDPEQFVKLSLDDRNKIRRAESDKAYVPNKIAKLKALSQKGEERYRRDYDYFLDVPNQIAEKSAYLQRSQKDSEQFKRMFDSLVRLRQTDGYSRIDQLLSEGDAGGFIENLNQAVRDTQNYITYANQKTIFQKGVMGTKRLNAARATLQELTELQQNIQSEQKFMRETKAERATLAALEKQVNRPLNETGMEFAPKPELDADRVQMTVKDLSGELGGKNKILEGWTVVEQMEKPEPVKASKTAAKGSAPAK